MKSFLSTIVLLLMTVSAVAVPADRVVRNVVQPDGLPVAVCQYGDEHFHYVMTTDGFLVTNGVDGGFYYSLFKDNRLSPSSVLAHNADQRGPKEKNYLVERQNSKYDASTLDSVRIIHRQLQDKANIGRLYAKQKALGVPSTYIGQKKGLVILVEFPNLQMSSQSAQHDYNQMFNSTGYSDNNHVGSVHDYFFDQSYGLFDLFFDIIGPVTVSRNHGYYGSDSMSGYNDMNVREMISEACILADEYVDFRDYDWDSDGVVDQVFIIYAGYGQATGGPTNSIWPHESYLDEGLTLDGATISQYACSNELYGSESTRNAHMGIGVACHEFSHCLGLPDLYDTDYSGAFGMSYWSLMNSGSYNGPMGIGEVPCGYTAYERWFAGWLDFTEIDHSQHISDMLSLEKAAVAYKLANGGNADEFYTIENRQPDKWFSYVNTTADPHGLLITHIDFNAVAWRNNRVNPSPRHQRMSPVVADKSYGHSSAEYLGDLFPGSKGVTELTDKTHADYGGMLFNPNSDGTYNMNRSILDITENNGVISFDVICNEELPTPSTMPPSEVSQNTFTAQWTNTPSADNYDLRLRLIKTTKPYIEETTVINHITGTSYIVNDLTAEYCIYSVRAVMGELHTEWSNEMMVSLADYDDILEVTSTQPISSIHYNLGGIPMKDAYRWGISIGKRQKNLQHKR